MRERSRRSRPKLPCVLSDIQSRSKEAVKGRVYYIATGVSSGDFSERCPNLQALARLSEPFAVANGLTGVGYRGRLPANEARSGFALTRTVGAWRKGQRAHSLPRMVLTAATQPTRKLGHDLFWLSFLENSIVLEPV